MANGKREFPPKKLADLGRRSAGNFMAMLRALKSSPSTLVLGAGVSTSVGLPSWDSLLEGICASFFFHWEFMEKREINEIHSPPTNISIAFYGNEFWSKESKDISKMFSEQDALLVAQQIKNCISASDWRYLIRKILYNCDLFGQYKVEESELIINIAKMCRRMQNLQSVISYNWDNLVEIMLAKENIKIFPVWESKQSWDKESLPIYYPHGYLPIDGGPVSKIILAESDYHQAATEVYSWANIIQIQTFSSSMCIFIGCSMVDPNLRRLLEISTEVTSAPNYALLPSEVGKDKFKIMSEILFDHDLRRLGVKVIRYPIDKSLDDPFIRLPKLIGFVREFLDDEETIWE